MKYKIVIVEKSNGNYKVTYHKTNWVIGEKMEATHPTSGSYCYPDTIDDDSATASLINRMMDNYIELARDNLREVIALHNALPKDCQDLSALLDYRFQEILDGV